MVATPAYKPREPHLSISARQVCIELALDVPRQPTVALEACRAQLWQALLHHGVKQIIVGSAGFDRDLGWRRRG
jgi:hypothetical protein